MLSRCPAWKEGGKAETLGFVPKWVSAPAYDLNTGSLTPMDKSSPRCVTHEAASRFLCLVCYAHVLQML